MPRMSPKIIGLLVGTVWSAPSLALACAPTYVVQEGDTLFSIAETQFGDLTKWSLIFYNNPQIQAGSLLDVPVGTELTIPCPDETPIVETPVTEAKPEPSRPVADPNAEIRLLTGSGYAPFADLNWPSQGMLTELVNAAFEESDAPLSYAITWEDNWAGHSSQLGDKDFDMGFPWFRPDCEIDPSHQNCVDFHFSDPLVDLVNVLFVKSDSDMGFDSDADIEGKTLCRPARRYTYDLDRAERAWLSKGLITLEQPQTAEACFDLLMEDKVDAVALDEFSGTATLLDMDLNGSVVALPRALSVESLYVVISKQHWRGTTHLYRFNSGLANLKRSGRYNEIINRHLSYFRDQLKG